VTAETLPALNSLLNALATVLLIGGYIAVRRGKWAAHGWIMGSAFLVSAVFLVFYLIHKFYYPNITMDRFPTLGSGWKYFYWFIVLIPHLVLAIVMLPMIALALWSAYERQWARHRRIAKVTIWVWLYVSVTGVLIYWLLYHLFPAIGGAGQA
jgi:uncharacterized membrane protein YozB (DUF420 family)